MHEVPVAYMPLELIVAAAYVLIGVLFVLWVVTMFQLRRVKKRMHVFLKQSGVRDLPSLIDKLQEHVTVSISQMEQLQREVAHMGAKLERSPSFVGLKRYNAFDEGGSELSFSLCIVNSKLDGVVLSALHSRDECRVYAKPVQGGTSAIPLSPEEMEVMAQRK